MRLRIHHRNLLALTPEEKRELYPSFEAQLVPLSNHITTLRRLPEFKAVEYLADLLLKPGRSQKRRRLNDGQFLTTNPTNLEEREEEGGGENEEEKAAEIVRGEEEVFSQSGFYCKICVRCLELLEWLRRGWAHYLHPSGSLSSSMPGRMFWLKQARRENVQQRKMVC